MWCIQPPPHTQLHTGAYTNVIHRTANTSQAENFIRSTADPRMMATEMPANVIWNTTNIRVGMVPDTLDTSMPARNRWLRLPIRGLALSPNAREYPHPTHTRPARQ